MTKQIWSNSTEVLKWADGSLFPLLPLQAEARLAAKRAARAEAREIRMKELERQQKEVHGTHTRARTRTLWRTRQSPEFTWSRTVNRWSQRNVFPKYTCRNKMTSNSKYSTISEYPNINSWILLILADDVFKLSWFTSLLECGVSGQLGWTLSRENKSM